MTMQNNCMLLAIIRNVPRLRLERSEILDQTYNLPSLTKGQCAIANWDEDAVASW